MVLEAITRKLKKIRSRSTQEPVQSGDISNKLKEVSTMYQQAQEQARAQEQKPKFQKSSTKKVTIVNVYKTLTTPSKNDRNLLVIDPILGYPYSNLSSSLSKQSQPSTSPPPYLDFVVGDTPLFQEQKSIARNPRPRYVDPIERLIRNIENPQSYIDPVTGLPKRKRGRPRKYF